MSHLGCVWVMAGGTGGHIVPGLAVAEKLQQSGCAVRWLGNPERMEGRLVAAAGLPMVAVRFGGVRGKGLLQKLKTPFSLMWWVLRVLVQMLRQRPDVVIGMGGYVSVPGGLAAWLARVPIVLHEQNAIAGMSNRYLSKLATQVLTGFPDVLKGAIWSGNPVRASMMDLPAPQERYASREGPLRVLVVGGSLGASALNTVLPQTLAKMTSQQRVQVVHQSGAAHLEALRQNYAQAGVQADCQPFIEDMASAMAQADLLICRAGAMTVSEVAAVGVAALFVPFPFAVDDHQTANASHLVAHGAAFLRAQVDLTPEWLSQWLLVQERSSLAQVASRARDFAKIHATDEIVEQCLRCIRREP